MSLIEWLRSSYKERKRGINLGLMEKIKTIFPKEKFLIGQPYQRKDIKEQKRMKNNLLVRYQRLLISN